MQVKKIISETVDSTIISGHDIKIVKLNVQDFYTKEEYLITVFKNNEDRKKVLKYYSSKKVWDLFFKIKNHFPELRPIAASTAHKAQGSSYDIVIVDLEDIGNCSDKEQVARMQYVALSRARNKIYIKGELPERFFK